MGNARVTAKNLKVVKVDNDENLLLVKGSVPGPSGTYIFIRKARKEQVIQEIRKRNYAGG